MTIDCIFQRLGIFHTMSIWWWVAIATPPQCFQPHPVTLNTINSSFPILFLYKNANDVLFLPKFFSPAPWKNKKTIQDFGSLLVYSSFMGFWRVELRSAGNNRELYVVFFIRKYKRKGNGSFARKVNNFIENYMRTYLHIMEQRSYRWINFQRLYELTIGIWWISLHELYRKEVSISFPGNINKKKMNIIH